MNTDKKASPKLPGPPVGKRINLFLQKVAFFLVELVAPTLVGLVAWYLLALAFKFWHMSDEINTVLLVATLIIVSFIINRTIHYFKGSGQGKGIVMAILSAVVIPVLVAFGANTLPVSGRATVVGVALNQLMGREDYPFINDIGNTVIASGDPKTKLDGIETLKTIHTELTLYQLFRVLDEDKTVLRDFTLYDELSKAIASYDLSPRDALVKMLRAGMSAPQERSGDLNLYSSYYQKPFDGVRQLVTKETTDPAALKQKLLKLDEAESQLKQTLSDLNVDESHLARSPLNFALDTLLRMDKLASDDEIYNLAKTITADTAYAGAARYDAILLVAKLGTKDDFNFIVPYLGNNNEFMKAGALEAIGILHARLLSSPEPEKKNP